jgi:hypothetical protein
MADRWELIGTSGLQFFGKMTASLSHEIKNVLAIVNEDAGLIEDYCLLAGQGRPVDSERLKALAGKIRGLVRRADSVVKNLNRLSHSIDETVGHIDVSELLAFLVTLSRRLAYTRGVALELEPSGSPVTIVTSPFLLQDLAWRSLDFAMGWAGEGRRVTLFTERDEEGVRIRFRGLEGLSERNGESFPAGKEEALLDALGARAELRPQAGELVITLPGQGTG